MVLVFPCFPPDPPGDRLQKGAAQAQSQQPWVAAQRGSWRWHQQCHAESHHPHHPAVRAQGQLRRTPLRHHRGYRGSLNKTNVGETRGGGQKPTFQRGQLRSDRSNFPPLIADRDPMCVSQIASRGGARPFS